MLCGLATAVWLGYCCVAELQLCGWVAAVWLGCSCVAGLQLCGWTAGMLRVLERPYSLELQIDFPGLLFRRLPKN